MYARVRKEVNTSVFQSPVFQMYILISRDKKVKLMLRYGYRILQVRTAQMTRMLLFPLHSFCIFPNDFTVSAKSSFGMMALLRVFSRLL